MNNSFLSFPTTDSLNATAVVSNSEVSFSPIFYKFTLGERRQEQKQTLDILINEKLECINFKITCSCHSNSSFRYQ